jgi:hypothetical protein
MAVLGSSSACSWSVRLSSKTLTLSRCKRKSSEKQTANSRTFPKEASDARTVFEPAISPKILS